jgi:hypothetical protein
MQDYLGGWWDATLRGARTGSVLEGGARFLVEENYPGDPDDPFPQTWVPLVYYGPQPYPFQTPQVLSCCGLGLQCNCSCLPLMQHAIQLQHCCYIQYSYRSGCIACCRSSDTLVSRGSSFVAYMKVHGIQELNFSGDDVMEQCNVYRS